MYNSNKETQLDMFRDYLEPLENGYQIITVTNLVSTLRQKLSDLVGNNWAQNKWKFRIDFDYHRPTKCYVNRIVFDGLVEAASKNGHSILGLINITNSGNDFPLKWSLVEASSSDGQYPNSYFLVIERRVLLKKCRICGHLTPVEQLDDNNICVWCIQEIDKINNTTQNMEVVI